MLSAVPAFTVSHLFIYTGLLFLFIFFFYAQALCSLAEPGLQYRFRKRQL